MESRPLELAISHCPVREEGASWGDVSLEAPWGKLRGGAGLCVLPSPEAWEATRTAGAE